MDSLYRMNRVLMFLTMLLYVPLVLSIVAGIGIGLYLLMTALIAWIPTAPVRSRGLTMIFLVVMVVSLSACSLAFALLVGLCRTFVRLRSEPVSGVLIAPSQNKPFFELLSRVCNKLKVRPPEQCYLSPFSDTYIGDRIVTERDGSVRRNVRTLVVGAGLLVHIRIDELTTILCHEMAHAKAGDTKLCWWATRFYIALGSAIYAQMEEEQDEYQNTWMNTAAKLGLIAYFWVFSFLYATDERWCELRADRMSAKICGPQNVRNALIKIHLSGYLPDLSLETVLIEYCQNEKPLDNLYDEYRRRWEELPTEKIQAAENQMFMDRHTWFDSHPCLSARIRGLRDIEARELTGDKPATRLFTDWPRLSSMMTDALIRRGRYLARAYMASLLGGR